MLKRGNEMRKINEREKKHTALEAENSKRIKKEKIEITYPSSCACECVRENNYTTRIETWQNRAKRSKNREKNDENAKKTVKPRAKGQKIFIFTK